MKTIRKMREMSIGALVTISVLIACLAFAEKPESLTKPAKSEKINIEKGRIEPVPLAVPLRLDYQGYLTDNAGNAVTDTATMVFRVYTASSGGTELWNSGNQLITVENGVFHSILANVPMSVFEVGQTRWLELTVKSQVLSPRTEITSVPWSYSATIADSAGGSIRIGGQTLANLDTRYINSGETAGGDLSGTYPNPTVARIQTRAVSGSAPSTGQVLKWNGTQWAPANDVSGADNDWVIVGNDMYSGVSGNVGIGTTSPQNKFSVNGVICGGTNDTVKAVYGGVLSGYSNLAGDAAADTGAVVCGGWNNTANARWPFVGGGYSNTASEYCAVVGGGRSNTASSFYATVAGGSNNTASINFATVAGGYADTSAALYSFTAGDHSVVPAGCNNSVAFNGMVATTSSQTRVGVLSKASGTFTIDHPLDPMNKILNHYFIESPEMVLIYRGIAVIGADGQTEVSLPDYFDALNKNPQIQLTGVGTYEVFIAEKVRNNSFVIGGKPGTEVHWTVTGERKDPSAEITKIIMPVEQPKDGALAGRSLDDDFLCATREQLEQMGEAYKFHFRTQAGTQRYEEMKKRIQVDK